MNVGLENYPFLTPRLEAKNSNLYRGSTRAILVRFSNAAALAQHFFCRSLAIITKSSRRALMAACRRLTACLSRPICHNLFHVRRYRLSRRKQLVEEYFDLRPGDEDWPPRYNIAPTQPVPVIRQNPREPRRETSLLRWGLIPSRAKDSSGAARMINARSETAATMPAFRDALTFRRCMIPADGFYEWKKAGTVKQPYCFEVDGGRLFAFAGIWDRWKDESGNWVETCSILTTTPNAVTSVVHDRMPVILDPASYDPWLDPGMK
jgi:putative SOS response-associated peptidase YedK